MQQYNPSFAISFFNFEGITRQGSRQRQIGSVPAAGHGHKGVCHECLV